MSDLIERQAVLRMLRKDYGALPRLFAQIREIPAATATGTKPIIDWAHVAPEFNWLAHNDAGDCFLFSENPKRSDQWGGWVSENDAWDAAVFASYTPGTCDWRDSLIMRPGHVEADE